MRERESVCVREIVRKRELEKESVYARGIENEKIEKGY